MTKSICALVHKPGSTRDAFQRYYEDNHAPLAISLFPFSGYTRNHVVGGSDFAWDTISEFWSQDIEEAAALMNGPIGETMRADEEKFMDRTRIAPAGAEELIVSRGERADAERQRTALLIEAAHGDADWRTATVALAEALGHAHSGVSVDFATSWGQPSFPGLALVWLPGWHKKPDAPDLSLKALHVVMAASDPATLLG